MPKNKFGKSRKPSNPYAVYADPRTGWTWKVLKTYKHVSSEAKDPYARWYMATTSPWVTDELGDGYATEVIQNGILVDAEPDWRDEYKV
jgi:hypothetical protein